MKIYGLADPFALVLANSCFESIHKIGMPEARIILAETVIYLAKAKKSNSAYMAINSALKDIKEGENYDIPRHLKNLEIRNEKENIYKYPHDYPGGIIEQQYLPDELKDKKYYIDKWGNDEKK